jgi:4-amino-4-deoxy-L-arabinose transferase-like glycosyltransferase
MPNADRTRPKGRAGGVDRAAVRTPASRIDLHTLMFVAGLAVVAFIRLRLLAVPFERDEGEYAYVGNIILRGGLPYRDAYNMKLPGVYGMYALIISAFGSSPVGVHAGFAVLSIATMALLYAALRRLFTPMAGLVAAMVYGLLSVSGPLLGPAAHATHFVNFFVALGLWIYSRWDDGRPVLFGAVTGLTFGLAFLMKQHALFLAAFGGAIVLQRSWAAVPRQWTTISRVGAGYLLGAAIPYLVVVAIMAAAGSFGRFWFWTVTYATSYASAGTPWEVAKALFLRSFGPAFTEYPMIWLLALAGLAVVWTRRYDGRQRLVALGLALSSCAAVVPGFNFREHYFVLLLPAAGLLCAIALEWVARLIANVRDLPVVRALPFIAIAAWGVVAMTNGRAYYLDDLPDEVSRTLYAGNPFVEAREVGARIAADTASTDTIAILGSEPEILVYAGRRSATGYMYVYPLVESQPANLRMQREMIAEIEAAAPKYLVYCNVPTSWSASPGAPTDILQWFNRYAPAHYDVVGIVEIGSAGTPPAYVWGADARQRIPGPNSLWVMRRRSP